MGTQDLRYSHEWTVVGEPGRGRFVECDAHGVPTDAGRYRDLRAAETRGELTYLGIREHDSATSLGTKQPDADEGLSYRSDTLDGAAVSDASTAGAMGLFRDG